MIYKIEKDIALLEFLQNNYAQSPKTRLKKWIQNGLVKYNGKVVSRANFILKKDAVLEIDKGMGTIQKNSENFPFPILVEDEYILAIDKPVGIASVNTGIENTPNVHKVISSYYKSIRQKQQVYIVHRIDKEVSGVLLFAKTEEAMNIIKDNWGKNEKIYVALVEGSPEQPEGTIQSWLKENANMVVYSTHEEEGAKFASTNYKVIKTLEKYSLIEVKLETGRKNQIRVHLSDIGCPIVGDTKYGSKDKYNRRVRLHAKRLELTHPINGKRIKIESPLPGNFLTLKNENEKY
jgi:23S rRNA pseudouridine1911/1915/1917 synthase